MKKNKKKNKKPNIFKRFFHFVFSYQYSKLLIFFETIIVSYLTYQGVQLAWACIMTPFTGGLPWVATMLSCAWAAYGVSVAFYYNKSKAEQVKKIEKTGKESEPIVILNIPEDSDNPGAPTD